VGVGPLSSPVIPVRVFFFRHLEPPYSLLRHPGDPEGVGRIQGGAALKVIEKKERKKRLDPTALAGPSG